MSHQGVKVTGRRVWKMSRIRARFLAARIFLVLLCSAKTENVPDQHSEH